MKQRKGQIIGKVMGGGGGGWENTKQIHASKPRCLKKKNYCKPKLKKKNIAEGI